MRYEFIRIFSFTFFTLAISLVGQCQLTPDSVLESLEEEELKNIDALAVYPKATRLAIMEACLHPEILIKIKKVQNITSLDIENLLEEYPQETQEEIWDLARYPDLISQLVENGAPSPSEIDDILNRYPEMIHNRTRSNVRDHFALLEEISDIQTVSESTLEDITASYDLITRQAIRDLIEIPEVLTILTDNIDIVILVGEIYGKYPEWTVAKADSLHLKLARDNAQELEDWKQRIADNPELEEELAAAVAEYRSEYENDTFDDVYYEEDASRVEIVERHYYHHYPYWYGYPSWYSYPRWRPYPYWSDWGFNVQGSRGMVVFHLPSYFFLDWYFFHPHHHHRYPHVSAHFAHHYHSHRRSVSSITSSVHIWRSKNRNVISDDMIANAPRRVNSYSEYGKMEESRSQYNNSNPNRKLDAVQYVENNKTQFSNLSREVQKSKSNRTKPTRTDRTNVNKKKFDSKYPTKTRKNLTNRSIDPAKQQTPNVIKKKTQKISKANERVIPSKAKDVHRRNWESSKSKTTKSQTKVLKRKSTNNKTIKPKGKTRN